METWTSTPKTILAAALGTLGVPIRLEKMLDEKTGTGRRDFFLGPQSLDGKYQTGSIKARFDSGELTRDVPDHPVSDIVWAKHSRDRILDCLNKGTRINLVTQSNSSKLRTFYHPGGNGGFPGVRNQGDLLQTRDLNLVAALSRFGIPILNVEGQGMVNFILPARQHLLGTSDPVGQIVQTWRAKDLNPEHPFAYAMHGLLNYARLIKEMDNETEQVLIRKPKSSKAAYIDPDTTGRGMDKMRRFFLG